MISPEEMDDYADEVYYSRKVEAMLEWEMYNKTMCCRCNGYQNPSYGIYLTDGDFCCNDCRGEAIESGKIALCLSCGDYFWVGEKDTAAISCEDCKKEISSHYYEDR